MTEEMNMLLQALNASVQPNQPTDYLDEGLFDARHHFRSLLDARLASYPDARDIVDRYEESPDIWEAVIIEAIQRLKLTDDKMLLEAARQVLRYSNMPDPDESLG
jgi:hypothetical protein